MQVQHACNTWLSILQRLVVSGAYTEQRKSWKGLFVRRQRLRYNSWAHIRRSMVSLTFSRRTGDVEFAYTVQLMREDDNGDVMVGVGTLARDQEAVMREIDQV